jgi:hypothetical protein
MCLLKADNHAVLVPAPLTNSFVEIMTFDVLMYVVPNAVSLGYHIHHFPML